MTETDNGPAARDGLAIQPNGDSKHFRKNLLMAAIIIILVLAAIVFYLANRSQVSGGTAKLSWSANIESDLAGYKIYYGIAKRTGDCPPGSYP